MKLNIKLFSGGSFEYEFDRVSELYIGKMEDEEMDCLMNDLVEVLHDLEWYKSGDIGEEDYQKTLNEFKTKWFREREENDK